MAVTPKTVVRENKSGSSAWNGVVLLASMIGAFGILTLILANNHELTDAFMAKMPWPGKATSLGTDPSLAGQMRISEQSARLTTLADQTLTLVAEATVTNDSLIPVSHVVLEAQAYENDTPARKASSSCGKSVSDRLLRRLVRGELRTLAGLESREVEVLEPGEDVHCQVALLGVGRTVEEVSFRVASVEPLPGHRIPRFQPAAE